MLALPRFVQYSALALLLGTSTLASLPAHAVVNKGARVPEATAQKQHHSRHGGIMRNETKHREFSTRDRVEARIADLHDAIGVTPDQESEWHDVAQAMRDSESGVGELIRARRSHAESTNAIDDIKSYQAISQAHADNMSKFVDAFEPFYDDLSAGQKERADAYFRNFRHERMRAAGKPGMKATPAKASPTIPNDAVKVK